jgi:hypothetical protein
MDLAFAAEQYAQAQAVAAAAAQVRSRFIELEHFGYWLFYDDMVNQLSPPHINMSYDIK